MRKQKAMEFRQAAALAAQGATNGQALTMPSMYPMWAPDTPYGGEGEPRIVRRPEGKLYRIRQAHTSQTGWEPENTPAMWEYIDVEHAGTIDDRIPAILNMAYFKGKYYSEAGALYLCTRDSEVPMAYLPSQLVGQYFEVVAG